MGKLTFSIARLKEAKLALIVNCILCVFCTVIPNMYIEVLCQVALSYKLVLPYFLEE